jgi:hypothetical protein
LAEIMAYETAGDPISGCKWTAKSTEKIARELARAGCRVSLMVKKLVRRLKLLLDGVYVIGEEGLVFRRVRPPTRGSLEHLVQTIGQRVGAYLERRGLLVRDIENTYLALESTDASTMDDLLGHSISYRIAVGPHAGR